MEKKRHEMKNNIRYGGEIRKLVEYQNQSYTDMVSIKKKSYTDMVGFDLNGKIFLLY